MEDIFIGQVIDRSGSMGNRGVDREWLWPGFVAGYNRFKNEQAALGKGWMSVTIFDTQIATVKRAWALRDIPDLTVNDSEIFPRGGTALNDAIMVAVHDARSWVGENKWFTGKRMISIQTDGMENSSRTYTREQVAKELRLLQAEGWAVVYQAANQDAWEVGQQYGIMNINAARTVQYSGAGMAAASVTHSVNTRDWRNAPIGTQYGDVSPKGEQPQR